MQRSLLWTEIWHVAPLQLSFTIRAVYDQLPTGDNLLRWKLSEDNKCPLCNGTQTLHHVLSACTVSLASGRYTWRHNQVLQKIVQAADEARLMPVARERAIRQETNDWKIAADLSGMRAFSAMVPECGVRPDTGATSEHNGQQLSLS